MDSEYWKVKYNWKSLFRRDFFLQFVTKRSINYTLLVGMEQKTFTEHNLTFVSTWNLLTNLFTDKSRNICWLCHKMMCLLNYQIIWQYTVHFKFVHFVIMTDENKLSHYLNLMVGNWIITTSFSYLNSFTYIWQILFFPVYKAYTIPIQMLYNIGKS